MLSMEDQFSPNLPYVYGHIYKAGNLKNDILNNSADRSEFMYKQQYWNDANEIHSHVYAPYQVNEGLSVNSQGITLQHQLSSKQGFLFHNVNFESNEQSGDEKRIQPTYSYLSKSKICGIPEHTSGFCSLKPYNQIKQPLMCPKFIDQRIIYSDSISNHIDIPYSNTSIDFENEESTSTKISSDVNNMGHFRVIAGPDSHQVKDWYITPTNILELNYEPENSDIIAVFLRCDVSMGLSDPDIFLSARSPKFNTGSNQIHLPNLKIVREMIQGPTKGFKFCLMYILLSKGKEVWRVKSDPFYLWSSGGFPQNLNLIEKQKEHQKSMGQTISDERESPKKTFKRIKTLEMDSL